MFWVGFILGVGVTIGCMAISYVRWRYHMARVDCFEFSTGKEDSEKSDD